MRIEGAGKQYRRTGPWVVRDLTAEITAGQLIRIDGGNGSGKTTLARMIAGVCEPSRGRVTGRPRTGYVPERFPPALPFTPHGYLTHLGRVHGVCGRELTRRIDGWLDRLGIGGYSGTPLRRLSKGTCQKVAVAQALLAEPELLVLDEVSWRCWSARSAGCRRSCCSRCWWQPGRSVVSRSARGWAGARWRRSPRSAG